MSETFMGVECLRCRRIGLMHCVCDYIERLAARPQLHEVAVEMTRHPLPMVDGRVTVHFVGCPCLRCFDRCVDWFVPMPAPPSVESWSELKEFVPCVNR